MNKLTAEKCREQLDECRALKERGYLSINGEYKLQALEIALPVLEQQEKGSWIEWSGGECPVENKSLVEVKFSNGKTNKKHTAGEWGWHSWPELPMDYHIIAYRVIENNGSE